MSRIVGRPAARIGHAIDKMRKEGVEEDQAIAKAYAMEKRGHLRDDGSYIQQKKG